MADKALLCGINTYQNVNALRGCINDIEGMSGLLKDVFKFAADNVITLRNNEVTKTQMRERMQWLMQAAVPGDRLVFHFSGHGSYTASTDPDETDGRDELICLYDMDFENPDSYFRDKELRDWTKSLPAGVQLTIVLDSCHSGDGTRAFIVPDRLDPSKKQKVLLNVDVGIARSMASAPRGIGDSAAHEVAATDPSDDRSVIARFIDPPDAIKQKIADLAKTRAAAVGRGARGFVSKKLNHVLLAACRSDQTAADARIGTTFNGAFSYNLCKILRAAGADLGRKALIDQLATALSDGDFAQIPQLEAANADGPVFGRTAATSAPVSRPNKPTDTGGRPDFLALLLQILQGGRLTPELQGRALTLLEKIVNATPSTPAARDTGGRHLVYVHGICKHVAGYSDPWWNAMLPYTSAFGAGDRTPGGTRHEVLWSELVNERALVEVDPATAENVKETAARLRGVLEERAAATAAREAPAVLSDDPSSAALSRDMILDTSGTDRGISIPGFNCVDDFAVYMANEKTRAAIIARFTSVVEPLLAAGLEVDVISHSWGTVVAYEGLRDLANKAGATRPGVRNWFTLGSALSIGMVKSRLLPANRDGRRPANVRRWVNLDAKGDPIGGGLQGKPFQVDVEYLNLPNLGCGFLNFGCAHASYFQAGNVQVNRDILAAFIDRA